MAITEAERPRVGRTSNRSATVLPSVLLIGVAIVQMARAYTVHQSPWKGGGFGMFSTADAPEGRFLRCYLLVGKEEAPVLIPDPFKDLALLAKTVPTETNLTRLSDRLAMSRWVGSANPRAEQIASSGADAPHPPKYWFKPTDSLLPSE